MHFGLQSNLVLLLQSLAESDKQYTLQLGTGDSINRWHQCTRIENPVAITTFSIHETLSLLEKFGVSDEFYHELSMHHPSLARSYKVKQLRKELTSEVEVIRLPKPFDGAYRPFLPMLSTVFEYQVCATHSYYSCRYTHNDIAMYPLF